MRSCLVWTLRILGRNKVGLEGLWWFTGGGKLLPRSKKPLETGSERKERTQQVICHKARAKTDGLELVERKKGKNHCPDSLGKRFSRKYP